jgi:predicted cupin superfamily sugar epimerase
VTADQVIAALGLQPHPEGGWYRESFRDQRCDGDGRARSTAIYYLLRAGERSVWHRVDAAELWHFHAGDPLLLKLRHDDEVETEVVLGADLLDGQRPQGVVPAGVWQAAEPLGAWTLVGCTVAPGFMFEGFELADRIG